MPESEAEHLVVRLRPHGRAMFWPCVLLVALAGAFGFVGSIAQEQWQFIAALSIAGVLALLGWAVPLVRWSSRRYTLTTRRIIVSEGVLFRSRHEVMLARATGVTVTRGPGQAILGCGDVSVGVAGDEALVLHDVPAPKLVQQAIHDLMARNVPENSFG